MNLGDNKKNWLEKESTFLATLIFIMQISNALKLIISNA